ncbi:MAG: carbamoyltransferase family protein [Planctomycetota bacterium]
MGINAYSHDAGAALLVDGALVFAAEQERYDRQKHSPAFPADAIAAALRHAGLGPGDVDAIAYCWRRDMARREKLRYFLGRLPRSLAFLFEKPEGLPDRMAYLRDVSRLPADLAAAGLDAPVTYVEHHVAHAVQAHRFGPADQAALITADGMGEWTAAATWDADGATPRALRTQSYPHSLGKFYAAVTQHLGFKPDSGEGKTMGLAPFAVTPNAAVTSLLRPDPERLYTVDLSAFAYPDGHTRMAGAAFEQRVGPARHADEPLEAAHSAIAAGAQAAIEQVLLDVARRLRAQTGRDHLGLAGGIFLNCVLNGRLAREAGFKSQFVFPAAGDAGAAAGAAALVAGAPRAELTHAYLGDDAETPAFGEPVDDPAEFAAERIAEGKVVGWFSGRMEFGPRALGARSILADPRDAGMQDRINRTIKFREDFRPFAPAVLLEESDAWFEDALPSPFMLLTLRTRPEKREAIPAVVHVDGSARVQTVARDGGHPAFRRLVEAFARRTGVPMVLNTSFNVRGEPIVRTPDEARALFESTALDVLIVEDRALVKP